MGTTRMTREEIQRLRTQLKALSNRYAIEILDVLNPELGDIAPRLRWHEIVAGVMQQYDKEGETLASQGELRRADVRRKYGRVLAGGTIYETMNRLVEVGYVAAAGPRAKNKRKFMITREGRMALMTISTLVDYMKGETDVQQAARKLLRRKNFVSLLPAQARFLDEVGTVSGSLMLQMPPGSGKTFLAMIVTLLSIQAGEKCLYVTPYLSLNRQVISEYGQLFQDMGYKVVRHDGQSRPTDEELESADIVVAVIESALSAVLSNRRWTENLGLVVIDELTELNSTVKETTVRNLGTDRSARLDILVALLKDRTRVLTLSSRFGATEEVTQWLGAQVFRPSVRLFPDEFIVTRTDGGIEIVSSDAAQSAHVKANDPLEAVLHHMGDYNNSTVLVVVGTRSNVEEYAERLAARYPRQVDPRTVEAVVGGETTMPVMRKLCETLARGVAFYHAGLRADVRGRLEEHTRKGRIRTVVSTTGITQGTSLPVDCVIILFDRVLANNITNRTRYLQIAGRIGEYHLAEHGGRVYLVFMDDRARKGDRKEIERRLLHGPLRPLRPAVVPPNLAASLIMRGAVRRGQFTAQEARDAFFGAAGRSFWASVDKDAKRRLDSMFAKLFGWLVEEQVVVEEDGHYVLAEDAAAAVQAGLDIMELVRIRNILEGLTSSVDDSVLIDIVLQFRLPQSIRPSNLMPLDIEVQVAGLSPPDEWYRGLVEQRRAVKVQILKDWIDELPLVEVIERAQELAGRIEVEGRRYGGVYMNDGDLEAFVRICSNIAWDISKYMTSRQQPALAEEFRVFSRRLQYGISKDLARSDLMDLEIPGKEGTSMRLTRSAARTLFDRGYTSIEQIVYKEVDREKEDLARDRFARKCGLEEQYARTVFKAALEHLRRRRAGAAEDYFPNSQSGSPM